jgi:ferritin-like metal-binding protein YciE
VGKITDKRAINFPHPHLSGERRSSLRERVDSARNSRTGTSKSRENMKLDTLKKLYVEELRDVYNAEQQLVKALPKMAKAASSDELREAFETHLDETKGHVERLEQIFKGLDEAPKGKTCQAMKGLIEEGSEILEEKGEESVLDAGIIAAAQKVEHYEMATYGTLRTWADLLNQDEAAGLLQDTLDEEGEADKKLNELAEEIVNPEALLEGEEEEAAVGGRRR